MRHLGLIGLCLCGTVLLAGCQQAERNRIQKEVTSINAADEANLDAIELTIADPNEAVTYFSKSVEKHPDKTDQKRYLAKSLVRAQRPADAAKVWATVVAAPDATPEDSVDLADAMIRANQWTQAQTVLDGIPPTHESFDRYRLEAMVADSRKQWKKADSFYEIAAGMTTTPAGIYNNWGISKMTRGDFAGAEPLFVQALRYDPSVFATKNNLVLARARQRKYDLPIIDMTQGEHAVLLYNIALTAIKQGDIATGKGLLQEAIDTNPEYFPDAVRALKALSANVSN